MVDAPLWLNWVVVDERHDGATLPELLGGARILVPMGGATSRLDKTGLVSGAMT
jgi:hypothetical protein